jgi:cytidyltransferase-like protein
MVSGCYDILHAGHIRFFEQAAALGEELIVCVATDATIAAYKGRRPAMPELQRLEVVRALRVVSAAFLGDDEAKETAWKDFESGIYQFRPSLFAVTIDDLNAAPKRAMLAAAGVELRVLPKGCSVPAISTSEIRLRIRKGLG